MVNNKKEAQRQRIRYRIRKKVNGTSTQPRLCVKKTNTAIYVQLVDDTKGYTLLALDTRKQVGTPMERAEKMAGELVGKIQEKKIQSLCYDRSGYLFHGIVKKIFETVQNQLNKQ